MESFAPMDFEPIPERYRVPNGTTRIEKYLTDQLEDLKEKVKLMHEQMDDGEKVSKEEYIWLTGRCDQLEFNLALLKGENPADLLAPICDFKP